MNLLLPTITLQRKDQHVFMPVHCRNTSGCDQVYSLTNGAVPNNLMELQGWSEGQYGKSISSLSVKTADMGEYLYAITMKNTALQHELGHVRLVVRTLKCTHQKLRLQKYQCCSYVQNVHMGYMCMVASLGIGCVQNY